MIFFNEYGQDNVKFQQDGATVHTAGRLLSILREISPGHNVSLRRDIGWLPRSPGLNPCDFLSGAISKANCTNIFPNCGSTEGALNNPGSCCRPAQNYP